MPVTENASQISVYRHSAEYAREHDELVQYRESHKLNIACKKEIEDAIHSHYADNHLDSKAAINQVVESFGTERMIYVLANTVREKSWDGRFSKANKAWADSVPVVQEVDAWGLNRNCYFAVDQAHPVLIDALVTNVRKELDVDKALPVKKPSVLEKLHKAAEAPNLSSSEKAQHKEKSL